MVAGFLAAAFASVRLAEVENQPWESVAWPGYGAGLVVGLIGVVLLRATARRDAAQSHKIQADLQIIDTSLTRLVAALADLNAQRDTLGVYEVHATIDANLAQDLASFADAREGLIPRYGLQRYADVMSRFATAERLINRSWSASVDGYVDEVWSCTERAETMMVEAHTLLKQYNQQSAVEAASS
jgi:hypothetical protein